MPKKILVLVANPRGTSNLNLLPEINRLKEELRRSLNADRFTVEWEVAVQQRDLRRHILDIKPQIVHFCGHGTAEGLLLEDDQGNARPVANEFIVHLLKEFADRIECVLINACDSGTLADELGNHLNYVIGMSQAVRDDAAIAFAEAFYAALGAGEAYERAFAIGRAEVLRLAGLRGAESRKAEVVDLEGRSEVEHLEHQIPVLRVKPNPTPIKPLWLSPEVERQAVRDLLGAIESGVNTMRLFHTDQAIVLQDQYIPIQVTLERRYTHTVETIGGYAESEAELRRIYAMKGMGEEEIKRQQLAWDEAKREQSRIVVLADPGMGKSTLLRREAGTMIQQGYAALDAERPLTEITLPLLMRLSTLADELEQSPVTEAILRILAERHSHLLAYQNNREAIAFLNQFLREQLLSGRGLLLLDALDEVPDAKRARLLEKLNEFAAAYPTCPIVATSRIVGYGGKLVDGAKEMEIVPFSQKQTEQYIETWFTNARSSIPDQTVTARGLIQALRDRPQLAGLAQNPLLLSLICSLYQQDKLTLPARRSQIYEQAVNCMMGEWSRTRSQHNPDRTMAKLRLLEAMAHHFTQEGQEVFDYEDLYDWVEAYLENGDAPRDLRNDKTGELIAELSEEDGILQKLYRDRSDRQYLFLHRTFQEYFTASYLKRSIKKQKKNPSYVTELVRSYCWKYRWHETLTLLAGLLETPMVLIEAIVTQKDDIFQTQLLLAGRCLAECRETDHPLADQIIDRIYQFWLAYPYAEFVESVVVAIGQTKPKLVQALQTAFNSEDSDGDSAAWILYKIGSGKTIDTLIQALANEETFIRYRAAVTLGRIGNEKAIDALIQALADENLDVRGGAAWILGEIGSEKAIDALIQALADENLDARFEAIEALGRIGSEKATDALIQALADESLDVRCKAAEALGEIGSEKATDALIQALTHENSTVRFEAIEALGRIGSEKATDALIQALADENLSVRFEAAEALGEIGSEKATDALIQALTHEDSAVRYMAAEAFRQQAKEKAIDALIQALADENLSVRFEAAEALGEIGSEKATDALIQALTHEDSVVRRKATEALGRIGSEKATDALIQALADENLSVKFEAIEALGRIGSEKATDALIQVLTHEDSAVRRKAAEALGEIGSEKAIDTLIQALTHEKPFVRRKAAEALGKIGSEKAIDTLIQALTHEDSAVRYMAIEALGRIGSEKTIDALIQALADENLSVKFEAIEALGRIGSEKATDALIQVLTHEDSAVRRKAAEALGEIGNVSSLEKLLQLPNLKWDVEIFTLARSWAVRFSESGSALIPVYPEKLPPSVSRQLDIT